MEHVPKFVGTDLNPIQIDYAKVAGTAKYDKGRRMVGDIVDDDDDDDDGDDLEDWNAGNNNEGDDDERDTESDFVQFGIDDPSWTWVVGIYNGRFRVRFVHVPNCKTKTLMAVVCHYCESGKVIHTDGWKAYNGLKDHGFVHQTFIQEENYVDPDTGARTQAIERAWVEVKAWWCRARGTRAQLQSHLDAISWLMLHHENAIL